MQVYVKVASNFISDDEDFEGSGFDNEDSPTASLMTGHSVTEIAVPHDCKYNPMLPLGSFIQESDDNVMVSIYKYIFLALSLSSEILSLSSEVFYFEHPLKFIYKFEATE